MHVFLHSLLHIETLRGKVPILACTHLLALCVSLLSTSRTVAKELLLAVSDCCKGFGLIQ